MIGPRKAAAKWVALMEAWVSWYDLATLQALSWEGDMGQSSNWYLYASSWAQEPQARDL